jgi:hypothetical protein
MNRAERKELAKVALAEARKNRDDCKQLKEVYKLFVQGKLNEAKSKVKADGLEYLLLEKLLMIGFGM